MAKKKQQTMDIMEFQVGSRYLLKGLTTVKAAVSSAPVIPILESVLVRLTDDGQLLLTGSRSDNTITTKMEANVTHQGPATGVAIPLGPLLDLLKKLPQQPVTVKVDTKNFATTLKSAYGRYKLPGENGEDLPLPPASAGVTAFDLDSVAFADGIQKVTQHPSTDQLRPAMTGVLLELHTNRVRMVATDAHTCARYDMKATVPTEVVQDTPQVIVPAAMLSAFRSSLESGEVLAVSVDKTSITLAVGNHSSHIVLIDARYPAYEQIWPNNHLTATVDRHDLIACLGRVGVLSNRTTNQIILDITDGAIVATSDDADYDQSASETMNVQLAGGDGLRIGFNHLLLTKALKGFDDPTVYVGFTSDHHAATVYQDTPNDASGELCVLVMPVHLS